MLSYNPIFNWTIWLLFFIAVCTTAVIRQATTFLSLKKDTRERVHTLRKTGGFLKTPTPVITTSPGDRVTNLQDQQNRLVLYHRLQLQCNPVNTVTNGPKRFSRMCINGGFFHKKMYGSFLPGGQKKAAVITRWPYSITEVAVRWGFTVFSKGGQ